MKDPAPKLHPPARGRTYSRFKHLKERGIVNDYQTLLWLIEHKGFPKRLKPSHKIRIFPDDEIDAWLEQQRVA
jgi:hypothetical protein